VVLLLMAAQGMLGHHTAQAGERKEGMGEEVVLVVFGAVVVGMMMGLACAEMLVVSV
jgi:hypothetical protein